MKRYVVYLKVIYYCKSTISQQKINGKKKHANPTDYNQGYYNLGEKIIAGFCQLLMISVSCFVAGWTPL